jgi:hypothetical protein
VNDQCKTDGFLNVNYSHNRDIESAYIITLKGDQTSEKLSSRCAESCKEAKQPYKIWDAFNGRGDEIVTPEHMQGKPWLKWIKVMDHHLSRGEIACFLSHVSLWAHCIELDKPIIILEHDAVVRANFPMHMAYNNIIYLGSAEQAKMGWQVHPIPMHASLNKNYLFIGRAHSYSIDPQIAKRLMAKVIGSGIMETLDIFIRADEFGIVQMGLFAYNEDSETTIDTRKPDVSLKDVSDVEPSKTPIGAR